MTLTNEWLLSIRWWSLASSVQCRELFHFLWTNFSATSTHSLSSSSDDITHGKMSFKFFLYVQRPASLKALKRTTSWHDSRSTSTKKKKKVSTISINVPFKVTTVTSVWPVFWKCITGPTVIYPEDESKPFQNIGNYLSILVAPYNWRLDSSFLYCPPS
jgi:hypothetical protein